ncbi:RNA-directed DNA polymerase, eukaryota, reverse transcriptase zinc-binding domain protein [Tanacetum coccineum]
MTVESDAGYSREMCLRGHANVESKVLLLLRMVTNGEKCNSSYVHDKDTMASYKEDTNVSSCLGHFHKVKSHKTGGSMLQVIEDLIKVGQTMGYKMEGCKKDIEGDYVIVMGDFNEVHHKDERYGSIFNARGADAFNSFISAGGLVEVPSGGYSFTWSHNSASKMSKLDHFLSIELAHKAKVKRWVGMKGDENSKIFHGIINKRRNNLAIRGTIIDGEWIEDPVAIKNEFLSHFQSRFEAPCANRLVLDMVFPNILSPEQAQDLEDVFVKRGNKESILGLWFRYKSPALMVYFGGNSSFIALILKFQGAKMVKDYRPISMRINSPQRVRFWGIAVDNSLVTQAANSIGCLTLSLPFQYLGVNIGSHMSRIKSWDIVLNKVQGRLSKWKSKVLSVGVDLSLFISLMVGILNIRKMRFVKWENVLASKDKGGMGVSSFFALNRALIFKWIWRFHSQGFSLWSRVIKAIHGVDGYIKKKVGNGEKNLFWYELWKGDVSFNNLFPRLFALE